MSEFMLERMKSFAASVNSTGTNRRTIQTGMGRIDRIKKMENQRHAFCSYPVYPVHPC
jgi:hypothetical protein